MGEEENPSLEEILKDTQETSPEKLLHESKLKDEVRMAMDKLAPREKRVLSLRYGLKNEKLHTLEDVGKILGLSRERVRQIETRALERLHRTAHKMGLVETATIAGQIRRAEKAKSVMRLSKGIIWSTQTLGKKLKLGR